MKKITLLILLSSFVQFSYSQVIASDFFSSLIRPETHVFVDVLNSAYSPSGSLSIIEINSEIILNNGTVTLDDGSTIQLVDDLLLITPAIDSNVLEFEYTVEEPTTGDTDVGEVFIEVTNPNPMATDDIASTTINTEVLVDVLANDTGDNINVVSINGISLVDSDIITLPDGATVQLNFNSTNLLVTPLIDSFENISFTYTIQDRISGLSDVGEVFIEIINPVNLSIEESNFNRLDDLLIYPNPTKGKINFGNFEDLGNINLDLFDSSGKKIISHKNINSSLINSFTLNHEKGVYFLKVFNESKQKIIKVIKN